MVLENKKQKNTQPRAPLAQNSFLKLTWLLLWLGWHPVLPPPLSAAVYFCCISLQVSLGTSCLECAFPLSSPCPILHPQTPTLPFHSAFSSPSDILAPRVPVPLPLFCSCEMSQSSPHSLPFSHLQPSPPTRGGFTWRPSLTLVQILYRGRFLSCLPPAPTSHNGQATSPSEPLQEGFYTYNPGFWVGWGINFLYKVAKLLTKHHKPDGLKQQKFTLSQFWEPEV